MDLSSMLRKKFIIEGVVPDARRTPGQSNEPEIKTVVLNHNSASESKNKANETHFLSERDN